MFEFTTMAPVAKHEGENATTAPAAKRERKNVALTDRMCETRVTKRTKIYDRKCPGLFVSITTSGVATFYYKFTNPGTGRQSTGWLGVYNPETFDVDHARTKVYGLRGNGAEAIVDTMRQQNLQQERQGRTVDQIIEERVEYMKTLVKKADGEMRPPHRNLVECREPSAPFRQSSARQEDRERGEAGRYSGAVRRHCVRRARRQAVGQQRSPHAARGVRPVSMGIAS